MSTDGHFPFCHLTEKLGRLTSTTCVAFFDGYPVAEGHALVIPRRHVASLFDLSADEFMHAWVGRDRLLRVEAEWLQPLDALAQQFAEGGAP